MKKETLKKVGKIVGDVVFGIFLIFILFIAVVNLRAKSTNGLPNLFGKGYLAVLSDSMDGDQEDSFKSGDLVLVDVITSKNKDDASNLNVGQIITYYDSSEEKIISHRIQEVKNNGDYVYYVVKGDNPNAIITTDVYAGDVIGIYSGQIKNLGTVFAWIGSSTGFLIIVVIPCVLFLVYEIYKFIKVLLEYNNEKNKEKGEDDKVAERKAVLDGLVKDGIMSQEQADAKLAEYIASLAPKAEEEVKEEVK